MSAYELRFHTEAGCWRMYCDNELLYPLNCGDPMLFQVMDSWILSNLELDSEWYVKLGDAKFWLHQKTIYRVQPYF